MSNIIDFTSYKDENEVLFDPILDTDFFITTYKFAVESLGLKFNRKSVEEIQKQLCVIDESKNNAGIVDIFTFIWTMELAYEDEYTKKPIYDLLNKRIDEYNAALKKDKSLLSRIKKFLITLK